jgi:hypothetical protein
MVGVSYPFYIHFTRLGLEAILGTHVETWYVSFEKLRDSMF